MHFGFQSMTAWLCICACTEAQTRGGAELFVLWPRRGRRGKGWAPVSFKDTPPVTRTLLTRLHCVFVFKVSVCSSDWPGTLHVPQAGLGLAGTHLPLPLECQD